MLRWIAVAALAIGLAIGYKLGAYPYQRALIKAQHDQMVAADLASRKEAERLAAEASRAAISQQLEDAANAQAPSSTCLPLSRVMRLNQR